MDGNADVNMDVEDNAADSGNPNMSSQDTELSERMREAARLANVDNMSSDYIQPNYPDLPNVEYDDWQYVMRRTMQEIVPGLFLGPYAAASKSQLNNLKEHGITHIVCVREIRERNLIRPNHQESFQYMVVEVEDSSMANIIPHFRAVNPFISEALSGNGRVLVHGSAGISRSVTLVIAYIMETFGVTTQEAYKYVQSIRFCSNPNEGFMSQLREYEPIYRARHVVPIPLPNSMEARAKAVANLKRSYDEDEGEDEGRGTHTPAAANTGSGDSKRGRLGWSFDDNDNNMN